MLCTILKTFSILILQSSQAYALALQRAGFLTEDEEQTIQEGLRLVNIFNYFASLEREFVTDCPVLHVYVILSPSDAYALS